MTKPIDAISIVIKSNIKECWIEKTIEKKTVKKFFIQHPDNINDFCSLKDYYLVVNIGLKLTSLYIKLKEELNIDSNLLKLENSYDNIEDKKDIEYCMMYYCATGRLPDQPKDMKTLNKTHYHEAAHLVFNVLVRKEIEEFPSPTFIEVTENEKGAIGGGFLTCNNNLKANNQLEDIKQMSTKVKVAELFHLMAGYSSYPVFYNDERDINFYDKEGYQRSDISKCNKICSLITESSYDPDGVINKDNKEIMLPIEKDVITIINSNKTIKNMVKYAAKRVLKAGNRMAGDDLSSLIKELELRLKEETINEHIMSHVTRIEEKSKKESGVPPQK
jgi:hypothetical protein